MNLYIYIVYIKYLMEKKVMMKKISALLLAVVLTFTLANTACASKNIDLGIDNEKVIKKSKPH